MKSVPLKRLVGINERVLPESTDPDLEFRYVDISTVGRGQLLSEPLRTTFAYAPSRARRLVRAGDTIVSTVRTYLRAIWPVQAHTEDLVVSTGFAVLTPGPLLVARYLGWLVQSNIVVEEIAARSVGVSYPAINASQVGEIRVEVPPLTVQHRIADFLDTETARLDALIAKKARLVEVLDERIDAQIRERIATGALVTSTPTTPVKPINRLLHKLNRPGSPEGNMITAFRDGQVTARVLRRAEGYTESRADDANVQGVRIGDVVIHGLDGFAGAVGASEADGFCSPVYHVCRPALDGDSNYVSRLLRILATSGYLSLFASSTRERAVDFRNWDLFGRIPIPDVPRPEQRRVGQQIARIRPLKAAIARSTELANEHRQALVTATVAGDVYVGGPRPYSHRPLRADGTSGEVPSTA